MQIQGSLVVVLDEMPEIGLRGRPTVTDRQPIRADYPHKELIKRLLADTCEICRHTGEVRRREKPTSGSR